MACGTLKPCLGLLLEMTAQLVIGSSIVIFRYMRGLPAEYFSLYVGVLQTSCVLPYAISRTRREDYTVSFWSERYVHLIRGVTGTCTFFLFFLSVQFVPATDVTAVGKLNPTFVTVLAYFWLGERPGWSRPVVLLVSVAGVVLVCRPSFVFGSDTDVEPGQQVIGLTCVLVGTLCLSVTYVCQCLMRRTPVSVCTLSNAVICTLMSLAVVSARSSWTRVDCGHAGLMFLDNVFLLLVVVFRFVSSRLEDAGRLAVVSVVDLPFVMFLEFLVFGVVPHWTAYLGVVLIVACILGLFLLKSRETEGAKSVAADDKDEEKNPGMSREEIVSTLLTETAV